MEKVDQPTLEVGGVRVAFEGCGHGKLDAIYAAVGNAAKVRGWSDGVDLLIIGGDFQAVRNSSDLVIMSVPAKYRALGDFPAYYSGEKKAPFLTIFIGGNHEAASHLGELYYGGWVAPNIYYLGAANVLRFGPLRIAGMSGIWKGSDYNKPHIERLPFNHDDVKSFYHVREIDIRKLLLVREQVDVGLSHDWPRAVERHGDEQSLWRMKPAFKNESLDGTLGNPAAAYVMDRLRPAYWVSAHMHCKFTAIKKYDDPDGPSSTTETSVPQPTSTAKTDQAAETPQTSGNPDEIDLDEEDSAPLEPTEGSALPAAANGNSVSDELRAQLPESFSQPVQTTARPIPGQPVPSTIKNRETRFMALDKALPGRKFLHLCYVLPVTPSSRSHASLRLEYDPEWLAITRVFHQHLVIGDREAKTPPDLGEATYLPMIDKEREWVEENIVKKDLLAVPDNFTITAPIQALEDPKSKDRQPDEYTSPQTAAFCRLLVLKNLWDASAEERIERKRNGSAPNGRRSGRDRGGFRGRGGGGGGYRGGFERGRGRGRGRGGWQ